MGWAVNVVYYGQTCFRAQQLQNRPALDPEEALKPTICRVNEAPCKQTSINPYLNLSNTNTSHSVSKSDENISKSLHDMTKVDNNVKTVNEKGTDITKESSIGVLNELKESLNGVYGKLTKMDQINDAKFRKMFETIKETEKRMEEMTESMRVQLHNTILRLEKLE